MYTTFAVCIGASVRFVLAVVLVVRGRVLASGAMNLLFCGLNRVRLYVLQVVGKCYMRNVIKVVGIEVSSTFINGILLRLGL